VGEIAHCSEEIDPAGNGERKVNIASDVIVKSGRHVDVMPQNSTFSFDAMPATISRHLAFLCNMAY